MVRYTLKERALIATKFEVFRSMKAVNRWWYQYNGKKNIVCKALCRSQEFVADHDVKVVKGMKGWGKRRGGRVEKFA